MGWRMSAPIANLFFLCLLLAADASSDDCPAPDCSEVTCDGEPCTGCIEVGSCEEIFVGSVQAIESSEASSPLGDICGAALKAMAAQCSPCSACTPGPSPGPAPTKPAPLAADECEDTAPSDARDKDAADCAFYADLTMRNFLNMCDPMISAYYSDTDFTGHVMCCACGGGSDYDAAPLRLFASGGPATWRGPSGAAAASLAAALSAVLAGAAAVFRCSRAGPAGAALLSEEGASTSDDGAPPL